VIDEPTRKKKAFVRRCFCRHGFECGRASMTKPGEAASDFLDEKEIHVCRRFISQLIFTA
jgi:hypothetical protein